MRVRVRRCACAYLISAGKEDCFYEKAPILFGERAYAFGGKSVCFLEKGGNKSVR